MGATMPFQHDYLLRRVTSSETMNPGPFSTIFAFVLLLLLLSNRCYFHPSCVTYASPGVAELTTQPRRPLRILWFPLCQTNKLGRTTREDYCDPLYLWDITRPAMWELPESMRAWGLPSPKIFLERGCLGASYKGKAQGTRGGPRALFAHSVCYSSIVFFLQWRRA